MQLPRGFEKTSKTNAGGSKYVGRFSCPEVQWTGVGEGAFCTFTITAGQLADAALSNIIWTDQSVQRGINPGSLPTTPRELSLDKGYPDNRYIFDANNADDMVEKLLQNEKLFLNPLIWNLRPGSFSAYFDEETKNIHIYSGKVFLPDSHHRHQAVVKATQTWREAKGDYPEFSDDMQFKVELYFLSREDEGNYFFDKNQRPKPVAQSKAFDLSTEDDLSLLAKAVIENSAALRGNVNRVTDRLTKKNGNVVTLSTLREVMKTISSTDFLESDELLGFAKMIASAFDKVADVRRELLSVSLLERNSIRDRSLVDSSVMFHGYAGIIKDYISTIPRLGSSNAEKLFLNKLTSLGPRKVYIFNRWSGDLFEKQNPIWQNMGVVRPNAKATGLSLVNTRESRAACAAVLRQVMSRVEENERDLEQIMVR